MAKKIAHAHIFMGTQETIIYPSYDAYFSDLIFWATFGGIMVWGL